LSDIRIPLQSGFGSPAAKGFVMRVDFASDIPANVADRLDNNVRARWCISVTTRETPETDAVMLLTEGQRDCLRLVFNHMKSKDIARVLDVSPHTVDMRLRTAMKTLGVTSRIEAARLLVQAESGGETTPDLYQPLIYQAPDVAETPDLATMATPALDSGSALDGSPKVTVSGQNVAASPVVDPLVNGPPRLAFASMNDQTERAGAGSFDPGSSTRPTVRPMVQSLPWGQRNDLSVGARLGWIFGIAVGSAMGFGAILAALAALKSLI
jgi:DNA-binding CsgD family transcriptional regulator